MKSASTWTPPALLLLASITVLTACDRTRTTGSPASEISRTIACDIGVTRYAWDQNTETPDNRIDTLETVLAVRIANVKIREYAGGECPKEKAR